MNLIQSKDIILYEKCSYQYINVIETIKSILKMMIYGMKLIGYTMEITCKFFSGGNYFKDHPILKGYNKY